MENYGFITVTENAEKLLVIASELGIRRVAFATEDFETVLKGYPDATLLTTPLLDEASRQFKEYFAGNLHDFTLPLDADFGSGYQETVLKYLPAIPYAETRSYAEVAMTLGKPNAIRATGTACSKNPVPIIVPCHRVIKTGGAVGNYLGGQGFKKFLLELERTEH